MNAREEEYYIFSFSIKTYLRRLRLMFPKSTISEVLICFKTLVVPHLFLCLKTSCEYEVVIQIRIPVKYANKTNTGH